MLVLPLALSDNRALRRLGTRRWKSLQRWNYAAVALTVVHGAAFQLLESRALPWVATFAVVSAGVVGVQAVGLLRYHGRRRSGGIGE